MSYIAAWKEQRMSFCNAFYLIASKCWETIQDLKWELGQFCLPHFGDEDKQVRRLNDLPCTKEKYEWCDSEEYLKPLALLPLYLAQELISSFCENYFLCDHWQWGCQTENYN